MEITFEVQKGIRTMKKQSEFSLDSVQRILLISQCQVSIETGKSFMGLIQRNHELGKEETLQIIIKLKSQIYQSHQNYQAPLIPQMTTFKQ